VTRALDADQPAEKVAAAVVGLTHATPVITPTPLTSYDAALCTWP
jgi:hypothetical protein